MFNLLPKAEKEAIRRAYRIRLAIVILWLSFATLIVASALLLPSFLLSSQKEKAAEQRFKTLSKSVARGNVSDLNTLLSDAQSRLQLLSHNAPEVFLYEMLMRVVPVKGGAVSLSGISFTTVEGKSRHIDITGVAKNRAALLAYVRALERLGLFEKVDVPISNFAKDADINFSLRASSIL